MYKSYETEAKSPDPERPTTTKPSAIETSALAAILALALAVRVWGISFGLPYGYHADESAIVRRALAFGLGDLNPHSFHWPAFHLYVLFGLYGLTYVVGASLGTFHSIQDFAERYFRDPTLFYLVGRGLSATLGTATVYFTYRAGRLLAGPRAGLLAALCLALTYYHARDSHLATLDVPATFWVALAFLAAVNIQRAASPTAGSYVVAGVLTGLAAATKYNAAIVIVAVFAAHAFHRARPPLRFLLAAGFSAATVFALASPFNFIDWKTFVRDFRFQTAHLSEGQWGLGEDSALAYYARMMLYVQLRNTEVVEFDPMALLFGAGMLAAVASRDRRTSLMVLVVPVAYLGWIGRWGMAATRYLDPIFPMLAVATGAWLARRSRTGLALASLALLLSLRAVLAGDFVLSWTDTRTEAKSWIEEHVPSGTRIALESYTPPLAPSAATIDERLRQLASGEARHPTQSVERLRRYYEWMKRTSSGPTYDLVRLDDSPDPDGVEENRVAEENYDIERLRALGVRYVIVSSFMYGRYKSERARELYPRLIAFYDTLERDVPRVKEFRPEHWRPGPTLRIYEFEVKS